MVCGVEMMVWLVVWCGVVWACGGEMMSEMRVNVGRCLADLCRDMEGGGRDEREREGGEGGYVTSNHLNKIKFIDDIYIYVYIHPLAARGYEKLTSHIIHYKILNYLTSIGKLVSH